MSRFILLLLLTGTGLPAQQPHAAPAPRQLGTVRFQTSCAAAAGAPFNRAVALLHSFAFSQAVDGFNGVLRLDGHCAMAYWGLALSAWGNPFAAGIKPPAQLARGLEAVGHARATGNPTERERRYIEAVAQLYENTESRDQRTRLQAYRDAMGELATREPGDTEAAIFHALAMNIAADPADKTYQSQLTAGATLEALFKVLPNHPGLAHYLIHTYDVPALAGRALGAARRYSTIAPEVSHALHMPSHIFTRMGDWEGSISANVASATAARREGSVAEELHAADYRVYAYLQTGQDRTVRRLIGELPALARRLDPNAVGSGAPPAAGYFALAAIPARYALERGHWAEAAHLPLSPSPVPWADAMTFFARALGSARIGDTAASESAIAALTGIRDKLAENREDYWRDQVEIQRRAGTAWLKFAKGRQDDALAELRAAAEMEEATEKNAITPGPLAPAREQLGEMQTELDRPTEALAAFEATLEREPNRYRALAGAARAAARAGDQTKAKKYYGRLLLVAAHADRPGRPELAEARRFSAHP